VGDSRSRDEERRKSPRFSVAGCATVHCLPLQGKPISALVRNLSAGGVCLDLRHVLELGTRTELLVSVNSEIFRAGALVREQREGSNARLQFVQISQGAKSVLHDLIERLTRLQALTRKLRVGDAEEDLKQALIDTGRFRLLAAREERFAEEGDERSTESADSRGAPVSPEERSAKITQFKPGLIEIDLFG
jgi:PilZ domain